MNLVVLVAVDSGRAEAKLSVGNLRSMQYDWVGTQIEPVTSGGLVGKSLR